MAWDRPNYSHPDSPRTRQRKARLAAAGWTYHRSLPDYWTKNGYQINQHEARSMTDEEFEERLASAEPWRRP